MGLGQNVFVFGLGVQFGGVLLEGDRFHWFGLLEGEGLAVIVAFFVFEEGLPGSGRLVETHFFWVLVGLGPDSTGGLFLLASDLHFQVADHPTITIIILIQSQSSVTQYLPIIKNIGNITLSCCF